jgi:hypothetical protein
VGKQARNCAGPVHIVEMESGERTDSVAHFGRIRMAATWATSEGSGATVMEGS